jgi:hypothetical protein
MNLDARIRAEHDFQDPERAQVMVSTEAGGEGINLQFCALMVNYDIPWNPNRLEQPPGDPLLETVIERLLDHSSAELRRGALFSDPDGRLNGHVWFIEGEIRDGAGEPAGKRLFALYQPDEEPLRPIHPSLLWDVKPAPAKSTGDSSPAEHALEEGPVVAFAIESVLDAYRDELLERRRRDAEIKQKYGVRSLEQMILEGRHKIF